MPTPADLEELANLLERRIQVIGDHEFRDRDAAAHLEKLKTVSEAIVAKHADLKGQIDPRLNHFLENCSYDKALDWVRGLQANAS